MSERAKQLLLMLHLGLQEIGKVVGRLGLLVLFLGLFFVPILALLMASFYAALGVGSIIGGGNLVVNVLLFFGFGFLFAYYIVPHVQPQIREAMMALLRPN